MATKKQNSFWPAFLALAVVVFLLGIVRLRVGADVAAPLALNEFNSAQVLGDYEYQASGAAEANPGIVYGFLPYWSLENYQIDPSVTDLSYFRLAVNGQGEIIEDAGYYLYKGEEFDAIREQVVANKMRFDLTFFTSISADIKQLFSKIEYQETFIENILAEVRAGGVDGVNLDLEYLGAFSDQERQVVTEFLSRLESKLTAEFPRVTLAIDVYGAAAKNDNIYDLPRVGKIVDRVIVMGYDYRTRGTNVPGATAPTLGEGLWAGNNIWEDIKSLRLLVPKEKIILAVPFYGYAWQTTTGELGTAKTYPDTGETMTFRGAQNILADKSYGAVEKWDETSLTPYLVFYNEAEERWHMGFFENGESLGYKIDLIEQLDLGGMAIWALGYEGEYDELWEVIEKRFE